MTATPADPITIPDNWPALALPPQYINSSNSPYMTPRWVWAELVDGVPLRFQRFNDRLYIDTPPIGSSSWSVSPVEEIVWYGFPLQFLPAWLCGGWRRIERRMARKAARRYRQLQAEQAVQSTPPERLFS